MCLFSFLTSNPHVKDEIMLLPVYFIIYIILRVWHIFHSPGKLLQPGTDNLITSCHELKAHKINKNYWLELPIDLSISGKVDELCQIRENGFWRQIKSGLINNGCIKPFQTAICHAWCIHRNHMMLLMFQSAKSQKFPEIWMFIILMFWTLYSSQSAGPHHRVYFHGIWYSNTEKSHSMTEVQPILPTHFSEVVCNILLFLYFSTQSLAWSHLNQLRWKLRSTLNICLLKHWKCIMSIFILEENLFWSCTGGLILHFLGP